MSDRVVTIFGGSGFLGRYVVRDLAKDGWRIRVAVRRPNEALFLRPMGEVGQIELIQANLRDEPSIARAIEDSGAVINLVGILHEGGHQSFEEIHIHGPARIAAAAAKAGVRRLVHVSAIGADEESTSAYGRSKAAGERALKSECPDATILRPSVLFGPEDHFFNRFANLARYSPALPLIGGGSTRLQPAYVGDVGQAIQRSLDDPASPGRIYELGGPRIYTFRELMELVLRLTDRRRLLISVPFALAKLQGVLLGLLPNPPLTLDQVRLLENDNIASPSLPDFGALGLAPHTAEAILPTYLFRFRPGGLKMERTA